MPRFAVAMSSVLAVALAATLLAQPSTEPTTQPTTQPTAAAIGQEITTASGLKIKDLNAGSPQAKLGDVVLAHYTGTLENGMKFDSSRDKGPPITFELGAGRVIDGWEEGIQGMVVGQKRILTVPANLAYRGRSAGMIPPNSILIFEIELVGLQRP